MLRKYLSRFLREKSGNFAMITAICILPMGIVVGVATDYSRASNARAQMQSLADSAALAAASSKKTTSNDLRKVAVDFVKANADGLVKNVQIGSQSQFDPTNSTLTVVLENEVPTTFMRLAGVRKVDLAAKAEAERFGVVREAEIALVLDTTFSMTEKVDTGETRLQALKRIANNFVDKTMTNTKVRMSVVPYSDYVKISSGGNHRRNAPWISVPADYDNKIDKYVSRDWVCTPAPAGTKCTVDGVQTTNCPATCKWVDYNPPRHDTWTDFYRFYGCVYSRFDESAKTDAARDRVRLSQDKFGVVKYPGEVYTAQMCENELVPLTNDKSKVKTRIDTMILTNPKDEEWKRHGIETYIPTGLEWGWNTLSSKNYFSEGTPNPDIKKKVLVLMSDGANTAFYEDPAWNGTGPDEKWFLGRHRTLYSWEEQMPERVAQKPWLLERTNNDTATLCKNIKDSGIEIYTISFGETNTQANDLLKRCATSPDHHYFMAMNAIELQNAFGVINESMAGKVRLVK